MSNITSVPCRVDSIALCLCLLCARPCHCCRLNLNDVEVDAHMPHYLTCVIQRARKYVFQRMAFIFEDK